MKPSAPPTDSYSNTLRAVGITFENILTQDPTMLAMLLRARAAAQGDVTVLILGETGTGKNLLAQAIHNASARVAGPYVAINCSAMAETLLESELFGHEKGSFTSADRQRKGCFERANHGTLFLDEIGDMSLTAQAKVLHAIEYKQFARVGGEEMLRSDVRIIAATNQPLRDLSQRGKFRADLYYRLAEVTLEIPALRHRKCDLPLYAEAFLEEAQVKLNKSIRKISRAATDKLLDHDWPGNVRELRAVIRSAVTVCKGTTLEVADLSLDVRKINDSPLVSTVSNAPVAEKPGLDLASVERAHIAHVLRTTNWRKKEAARLLGISRPRLDRKIEQYGLTPEQ